MKKQSLCRKIIISFLILFTSVNFCFAENNALSLYNKGVNLQQKEDYYSAVDALTEALQLNANYGDAWFHLAQCTYELGEYDLTVEYTNNAEKYSKNYREIKNLRGMALISLGKLKEAHDVFENVLKEYPNDVDSRFGLAQLDLFDGSLSAAESVYLDALKRQNTNKKALLSLALICSEMGKNNLAENYINQALEYHSGEAQVHYLSSYLALKRGDYVEAERRARSAVQLKGNYDEAYELLANILYTQQRYNEVIDICDFRIARNRNDSDAWYLKGLSEQRLGNVNDAISTFTTGLAVNSRDEIMRAALEELVQDNVDIEDSRRKSWADYHLQNALEYKRNYDGPSERFEYQQALKIDPLNKKARQSFADMLNRDGFYELYLSQLNFIQQNNSTNSKAENAAVQTDENSQTVKKSAQEIKNSDTIEALNSMMTDTLSKKWNVEPFYLDKTRWNIGIYYVKNSVQLIHADAEQIAAIAAKEVFSGVPSTTVSVQTNPVSGFGEAYKLSRKAGCDYFIIISVDETERTFTLNGQMYSSRTGTLTQKIHVYRTGNDKFSNVLRRFRQSVLDVLPIRGKVLNHTGSTILVDLGKSDGIVKGSEFDVVEKGSIYTADKGTGISYPDKSILGTFTIDIVDEEISEGTYKKNSFYDTLNNNDEVVLTKLPSTKDENSTTGNAATDTKPAALNTGSPATGSAKKAENDSKKAESDVNNKAQESALINLIRSIQ